MEVSRRNSSVGSSGPIRLTDIRKQAVSGNCTFVRLVHGGRLSIRLIDKLFYLKEKKTNPKI